ncbi:MAG: SBBP repeat-containing protein [Pseudomonadota bacterium]
MYATAVDDLGNVIVAGYTDSPEFPATHLYGSRQAQDVFVAKVSSDGSSLIWSTLLAGASNDQAAAIAVNAAGEIYVTGQTASADFPTTAGAFRRTNSGGGDAFVAKLVSDGSLVYSTMIGGSSSDVAASVAVDGSGYVTIAGSTQSVNFPSTPGAFKVTQSAGDMGGGGIDGFVTRFRPDLSGVEASTYLGSGGEETAAAVTLDKDNLPIVVGATNACSLFPTTAGAFQTVCTGPGRDCFISKLNGNFSGLLYSSLLGGYARDECSAAVVDAQGAIYVGGRTFSGDFPVTAGAYQTTQDGLGGMGFVAKFKPAFAGLQFATFLGGSSVWTAPMTYAGSTLWGLHLASDGKIVATGWAQTQYFPTTSGAYQNGLNGSAGVADAFVSLLSADGSALLYSSYLGSSSEDVGYTVGIQPSGRVVLAGYTRGSGFPVSASAFDRTFGGASEGFLTAIDIGLSPQ